MRKYLHERIVEIWLLYILLCSFVQIDVYFSSRLKSPVIPLVVCLRLKVFVLVHTREWEYCRCLYTCAKLLHVCGIPPCNHNGAIKDWNAICVCIVDVMYFAEHLKIALVRYTGILSDGILSGIHLRALSIEVAVHLIFNFFPRTQPQPSMQH